MKERSSPLNEQLKTQLKSTGKSLAVIWAALFLACIATAAPIVTITPDAPDVSSCLAFGAAPGTGVEDASGNPTNDSGFLGTSPFMGFIYKDIPAFDLNPGDVLAFDLGAENDFDVALDIEMAATTANGETTEAGSFTKVVSNTYIPLKPRGDTIIDNFDLRFVSDNAYSFPGGGLIIRFSNGSTAYRDDNVSCDQVGVVALSTDTSGFFVQAFWADEDGLSSPWSPDPPINLMEEIIGGFQVIEGPTVLLASNTLDQSAAAITTAEVGETITYQVLAQNPDQNGITGVIATVTLDDLVSFVQSTQNPPAGSVFDAGPPATIEWSVGSLAGGAEATLDVELEVSFAAGGQTISNSAEVTASDAPFKTGLTDQSKVTVAAVIDITGEMLDQSGAAITTVEAGEPFVYQVIASNSSQTDGTGVEVTVIFPEPLLFQQADSTPPAAVVFDAGPPKTVVWTVDNLNAGQDATLDIDVTASIIGSDATLIGSAAATLPAPGDAVETSIRVDPAVSISSGYLDSTGSSITSAQAGDAISYEIIVHNESQADATGLAVTATLADNLEFVRAIPAPADHDTGPPDTINWNIGDLAAGADVTLIAEMGVLFAAGGQDVSNEAEITDSDVQAMIGDATNAIIVINDTSANLLTGGSGNCFIATAAYGSYLEPEVMILRRFRDKFLLTNEPGRAFVDWYYRNSPNVAALIADNDSARAVVRILLSPIVYALKYPLAAMFSMFSFGLAIGWGRQSAREGQ